jgi:hypothetical protein
MEFRNGAGKGPAPSNYILMPVVIVSAIIMSSMITSIVATPAAPMIFTLETFVIKTPSIEIGSMISFEIGAIVSIVKTIAVMSMPGRIGIIGISWIISFIDHDRWRRYSDADTCFHANLRKSRVCYKKTGYEHGKDK